MFSHVDFFQKDLHSLVARGDHERIGCNTKSSDEKPEHGVGAGLGLNQGRALPPVRSRLGLVSKAGDCDQFNRPPGGQRSSAERSAPRGSGGGAERSVTP